MMNLLMLILVSYVPSQSIDIVAIEDTVFIAMDKSYRNAVLYRYESMNPVVERELGGFSHLSLGYYEDIDNDFLITMLGYPDQYFERWDTLMAIDPLYLTTIWQTGDIPDIDDIASRYVFIERWGISTRQPRATPFFCESFVDATERQGVASAAFDPAICPGWQDEMYYYPYPYGGCHDFFCGPVTLENSSVLTVTGALQWWSGSYWHIWSITAQVHEPESPASPDSLRTIAVVGYEVFDEPLPRMHCLGSCADKAILLWSDSTATPFSTVFSGDFLQLEATVEFGYSVPSINSGIAMSCNPADQGILLVYYSDGFIKARYWIDQWSPYEHFIAPSGSIWNGDLAVCSVEDGYWIAWMTFGADYPELAFIDVETLTGVEEVQQLEMNRPIISVSPNPFHANTVFVIEGIENRGTTIVRLYDCTGRIVRTLGSGENCNPSWNGCAEDGTICPDGAYIAVVEYGECRDACKVILLR